MHLKLHREVRALRRPVAFLPKGSTRIIVLNLDLASTILALKYQLRCIDFVGLTLKISLENGLFLRFWKNARSALRLILNFTQASLQVVEQGGGHNHTYRHARYKLLPSWAIHGSEINNAARDESQNRSDD